MIKLLLSSLVLLLFMFESGGGGVGAWMLNTLPLPCGFSQIALKQGSESLTAVPEFLNVQHFIFWQFTMHDQHSGLSWGHDTFSREMVSAFKEHKKTRVGWFLQANAAPWLQGFCSLIPKGHLVGSNKTAVLASCWHVGTRCVCLVAVRRVSLC